MRIAMFTNNYKPYIGGVPISIEHLAEALRKRGHEVYVFAPSYEGQEEEPYVIRYPSFPVKIAGAPVPNVLTTLFLNKVRELQIDLIHVHHPAIVGNVALFIRQKTGIPVIFTYHTRYEEYLHYIAGLKKAEQRLGLIDCYLKAFCNHCDLILAPTRGIRDYLYEKEIETPVGIMPTGIPGESFLPENTAVRELRQRYLGNADYLFCTVSRLAKEKNLMFQLEGLSRLKEMLSVAGKEFRHLIIGEGPWRKELEEKIRALNLQENVILLGNVANQEIKNYQAAADLFLFTSKSETQGIVLLEAMAVGTPVVAVNASGVCDIVEDGKNGYLTSEDAKKFAEHIWYLMEKKNLHQAMSCAARQTAEKYAEDVVAEQAELYYVNCVRRAAAEAHAVQKQPLPFLKRYMV